MSINKIYKSNNNLGNYKVVSDWLGIEWEMIQDSNDYNEEDSDYKPFIEFNEKNYYLDEFLRFNTGWTGQQPILTTNDNEDNIILSGIYVFDGRLFIEISDCTDYARLFEMI